MLGVGRLWCEHSGDGRRNFESSAVVHQSQDEVVGFLFQLPQVAVLRRGVAGWWPNRPVQANDVTQVRWE